MTKQIKAIVTNNKSSGAPDSIGPLQEIPASWYGRKVIVTLDPNDPANLAEAEYDRLIEALSSAAEAIDQYEFGLPSSQRDGLYLVIANWLAENGYTKKGARE